MTKANQIYADIQSRTGGNIYIGVVGPVRSGKSTFIHQMLEKVVLPHIDAPQIRERALDEMPQSSAGKTIMTTEPKFIPEEAVNITLGANTRLKVRLVDCVGFVVPSAVGYIEQEMPRMVRTPWSQEEIPFNMAAEIGTKKVITEHSTIGVVVTTDGSFTDIPRAEYEMAEERVIEELKAIHKPFVVVFNTTDPYTQAAQDAVHELTEKYGVPVLALNCLELSAGDVEQILAGVLFEFPLSQIEMKVPEWIAALDDGHRLKEEIFTALQTASKSVHRLRDMEKVCRILSDNASIEAARILHLNPADGSAEMEISVEQGLFYRVLEEKTGVEVCGEQDLMRVMNELCIIKKKYMKVEAALERVEQTGYGIVMPELSELRLEEPELMKQGGRYGVRLKASAPSIHMLRADIMTEVAPIVGSESQSEDLVLYLMKQFEENPNEIWNSDIFGKSIHSIVNEGLNSKLARMPDEAREKLRETVERVINEGCNGLICILL